MRRLRRLRRLRRRGVIIKKVVTDLESDLMREITDWIGFIRLKTYTHVIKKEGLFTIT